MGVATTAVGTYDAALQRRQALMGASGARALVKNWKVARIAAFACIGGILYGYNQGMFSGILTMPSFERRKTPLVVSWRFADIFRHGRLYQEPDQEGLAYIYSRTWCMARNCHVWCHCRIVLP